MHPHPAGRHQHTWIHFNIFPFDKNMQIDASYSQIATTNLGTCYKELFDFAPRSCWKLTTRLPVFLLTASHLPVVFALSQPITSCSSAHFTHLFCFSYSHLSWTSSCLFHSLFTPAGFYFPNSTLLLGFQHTPDGTQGMLNSGDKAPQTIYKSITLSVNPFFIRY